MGACAANRVLPAPWPRARALRGLVLALGLLVAGPPPALSLPPSTGLSPSTLLERRVKAAFLYHFAQLTRWPSGAWPEAGEPLVVAVVGEDLLGEAWGEIEGKRVRGRPVVVRRHAAAGRAHGCQMVFLGPPYGEDPARVLEGVGRGVLTVSDAQGFADRGGMIELVNVAGRVRFRINQGAARRAGLTLSARLLHLAIEVLPGLGGGGP
ncbi:MAG: hypothetical protein Kow0092_35710 [Deferrisomatales bacterium]